jgi:hypothetical protein
LGRIFSDFIAIFAFSEALSGFLFGNSADLFLAGLKTGPEFELLIPAGNLENGPERK